MQPNPMADTSGPLVPSFRFCMVPPSCSRDFRCSSNGSTAGSSRGLEPASVHWTAHARVGTMKRDVIIVGAGAAGLEAARVARAHGLSALVLEARDRAGGRILTVEDPRVPLPIELGAEFRRRPDRAP